MSCHFVEKIESEFFVERSWGADLNLRSLRTIERVGSNLSLILRCRCRCRYRTRARIKPKKTRRFTGFLDFIGVFGGGDVCVRMVAFERRPLVARGRFLKATLAWPSSLGAVSPIGLMPFLDILQFLGEALLPPKSILAQGPKTHDWALQVTFPISQIDPCQPGQDSVVVGKFGIAQPRMKEKVKVSLSRLCAHLSHSGEEFGWEKWQRRIRQKRLNFSWRGGVRGGRPIKATLTRG